MQSGCMFNNWAMNRQHNEAALELAKNLACPSDDSVEIVRYLKTLPASDLIKCTRIEVCVYNAVFFIFFFMCRLYYTGWWVSWFYTTHFLKIRGLQFFFFFVFHNKLTLFFIYFILYFLRFVFIERVGL